MQQQHHRQALVRIVATLARPEGPIILQNLLPCTKLERLIKLNVRNVLENEIERVRLDLHLTPQEMDGCKRPRNDGMVTLCYWVPYDRFEQRA